MRQLKNIFLSFLVAGMGLLGCTSEFDDLNTDPNNPANVTTPSLLINAQFELLDDIRDEWFSGRMALTWVQYWAQTNYTEEDRYEYRQNSNNSAWKSLYEDLMDLQRIIDICEDEALAPNYARVYGDVQNQIAVARILKSWTFQILTDTYGPVPYHSYGSQDADFQALRAQGDVYNPVYAPQEKIYKDLLNELKEAAEQINTSNKAFTQGDGIFDGDAAKWKKFANSLRLRVALRVRGVDKELADQHIADAIAGGVMEGNEDNAMFEFESALSTSAPMRRAFQSRTDFAVSNIFIDMLKGERGPFSQVDPRLFVFAAPKGVSKTALFDGEVAEVRQDAANYFGQPYGISSSVASDLSTKSVSMPFAPIKTQYSEVFMDYAEVCFILSEYNDWDQSWYEKGVRASLEKWGVTTEELETYMTGLPAVSQETALTQKYIALYMQPYNAWAEYRRTGFPTALVKPGEVCWVDQDGLVSDAGTEYTFTPLVELDDLPARVGFAQEEQLLNPIGFESGVTNLGGLDDMATKLWWDVN